MNFIELLFALQIEKESFSKYTSVDIIKIEKRLHVEKQINTKINTIISEKLINAIKTYPRELEDFLKKKSLVHLFLNKKNELDYNDLYGHPSFELFFKAFLEEDLLHIFKRKIALKEYKSLENVMQFESFFSYDFIDEIQKILQNKLGYAYQYYFNRPIVKHAEYDFLVDKNFFSFINHFNSSTIESHIIKLYNKVVDQVNKKRKSNFVLYALIAFSFYKADGEDFKQTLSENKTFARNRLGKSNYSWGNQKRKTSSGYRSFFGGFVIFIIIIRVLVLIGKSNRSTRNYPIYNPSTNYSIDKTSNQTIKKTFEAKDKKLIHYLEVDVIDKKYPVNLVKNIKTGDNPFDIEFPEFNIDNYRSFTFLNNSNHDMIVLEFEKFKLDERMSRRKLLNAVFVRSYDSIKLSNYDDYKNTSYLLYIGDSLANYKNPPLNDLVTQVYKKNGKIPESRFLHNIIGAKRMLNTFLKLKKRTVVTITDKQSTGAILHIRSQEMQQNNGSKYFTKKNNFIVFLKSGAQFNLITK